MSDKLYSNQSPLPSDLYIKKGGKVFTGDFYRVRNGVPPILQEKTATENGPVLPDGGYEGLSQVTVDVQPVLQEKSVTENGEVTADEGYDGLSKVMVDVQGGASFNIHYGTEPPTDTSKLWVETDIVPTETRIVNGIGTQGESFERSISILPYNLYLAASAVVGKKIYVFGGHDGSSVINKIRVFDTVTNTVETLSVTLPVSLSGASAAAVGKRIYLFGGMASSPVSTIRVFDTETNTIQTLSVALGTALSYMAVGVVGTKIYLIGGYRHSKYNSYGAVTYTYVFETLTHTFVSTSASLPSALQYIASAVVGKKIYLFGGQYTAYDRTSSSKNLIQVYDTETDTIETLSTKLPEAGHSMVAAAIGTKIYLLGGHNGTSYAMVIRVFDTQTNTLETLSTTLPTPLAYAAAGVIGTKVYIFGGKSDSGVLMDIHSLTATPQLSENVAAVIPSLTDNVFPLIKGEHNAELGVSAVYIGNSDADGTAKQANACLYKWFEKTTDFYKYSCKELTSGTELTSTVACTVGDLVIACIATRDTLTLSDGWTLISTSDINSSDTAGNGQRLSFAYKYAENTTESITVTQASEQRLYINLVALSGATGFIDNGYHYDNNENSNTQSITVDRPNGLVLWACSSPTWGTTSPYTLWVVSNNATILQLGTSTASRLGTVLDQTDVASVTFTAGASGTTLIVGSLTIEGMDEFAHTDSGYAWQPI